MSKPKFLYIDDENDDSVTSICSGFNDTENIIVDSLELEKGLTFDSVKERLSKEEFDGLILDLKLDGEGENRLNFKAPTLAQDIHTFITSNEGNQAFPIILCSTDTKMRATYDKDKNSHALFDYKFLKGEDIQWVDFSIKLKSLAEGYKILNTDKKKIEDILGREDLSKIDPRVIEKFRDEDEKENLTPYDFSNFVIEDLFHHPGLLIKDYFLASRLGVHIEKSGEDWNKLKEAFSEAKYTGIFSSGWNRWWSDKVIALFKVISEGERLNMLTAEERVEILTDKLNLPGLVPAEPIKHCTSSQFWTICEETKLPLDPLEGFKVYESKELRTWQESKYLSFYAIMDKGITKYGLKPRSSEKSRIDLMAESLS